MRSPYGYVVLRRPAESNDDDTLSIEEIDSSCDLLADTVLDCREWNTEDGDPVDLETNRSRPQSLVKSHQNEYSELTTTDMSLIERKPSDDGGSRTHVPKTKERVFAMPSLLHDGLAMSLN